MEGGLLVLFGAIALLVVLFSSRVRALVAIAAALVILFSARDVFIHEHACPQTGTECFLALQPSWSGPCFAGDRAGILKIDRQQFLTAQPGVSATATCFDVRFWL